jgi:hypothetical protein
MDGFISNSGLIAAWPIDEHDGEDDEIDRDGGGEIGHGLWYEIFGHRTRPARKR